MTRITSPNKLVIDEDFDYIEPVQVGYAQNLFRKYMMLKCFVLQFNSFCSLNFIIATINNLHFIPAG
jgi:hypothetical protein